MADETTTTTQAPPTPTAPHVDFTKPPAAPGENRTPPAPAPAATAAPTMVTLTVDEYQRFRGLERQLSDFQVQQQKALDDARNAELKAMADKGEIEKALAEQKKDWEAKHAEALGKHRALESQILTEKFDATINDALAGVEWTGDTPEQRANASRMFRLTIKPDFESIRLADGTIVVRDKASGRPAAEVLRERLSDPSLSFLLAPKSRGGSGSDGARPPANQQQPQPGSLEAIAAQFKANQGRYAPMGLGPVG